MVVKGNEINTRFTIEIIIQQGYGFIITHHDQWPPPIPEDIEEDVVIAILNRIVHTQQSHDNGCVHVKEYIHTHTHAFRDLPAVQGTVQQLPRDRSIL